MPHTIELSFPAFIQCTSPDTIVAFAPNSILGASFFDTLKTVITHSNIPLLQNNNNQLQTLVHSCFQDILASVSLEHEVLHKQYYDLFNNELLPIIVHIILYARNQTIEKTTQQPPTSEEELIQFVRATHSRIVFLIDLTYVIGDPLYTEELNTHCNSLIQATFADKNNMLDIISNGLYKEAFSHTQILTLKKLFEGMQHKIGQFEEYIFKSNPQTAYLIPTLKNSVSSLYYHAKYLFAFGQDKEATEALAKRFSIRNQVKNLHEYGSLFATFFENLNAQCKKLLEESAANPRRKAYAQIASNIEEVLSNQVIQITPTHVVQIGKKTKITAKPHTAPKKILPPKAECILQKIQKITIVSRPSAPIIENAVVALIKASLHGYYNKEQAEHFQAIAIQLQTIFLVDKNNCIVFYINQHIATCISALQDLLSPPTPTLTQAITHTPEQVKHYETDIQKYTLENDNLEGERAQLEATQEQQHQESLTALAALEVELQALELAEQHSQSSLEKMQEQQQLLQNEKRQLEKTNNDITAHIKETAKKTKDREKEKTTLIQKNTELNTAISSGNTLQTQKIEEQVQAHLGTIAKLSAHHTQQDTQLALAAESLQTLEKELTQAKTVHAAAQLALETLQNQEEVQITTLQQSLAKELEKTSIRQSFNTQLKKSLEEAQQKLAFLTEQEKSANALNKQCYAQKLVALEQFYETLTQQIDDLKTVLRLQGIPTLSGSSTPGPVLYPSYVGLLPPGGTPPLLVNRSVPQPASRSITHTTARGAARGSTRRRGR